MGQLIVKFRNGNSKKAKIEAKLSLPAEIEKTKSEGVIVNGIVFERKRNLITDAPKNRNDKKWDKP